MNTTSPDPGVPDPDEELRGIARGDPAAYQLLRSSLQRLAEGAGGSDLQEMAREVLAGRVTLRKAMLSGAYAEAFRPHLDQLVRTIDDTRRKNG
jgi:hypothetical protein